MQKNPINEGDSIQEPMTLQDYEDAVSLPDGIYPIEDDAGTVLDASIIAYGSGTVEDALTWKYLDSTTGNAEIEIPVNATEVVGRSWYSTVFTEFHFLTIEDDINLYRSGYYITNTNNLAVGYKWIKSTRKANLASFIASGTDYTSSASTKWYYK